MPVSIRFLGTAAFQITTASGKRILIDPYLDENPVSPIKVEDLERLDLLLVTHAAYDHLGDTEAILRRFPDLPTICGADVRGYLMYRGIDAGRLRAVPWGMMIEEAGVRIRPVESRHWSYIQAEDGRAFSSTPLGYVVYAGEGQRIYHSGDTALFSDLKLIGELYEPTVGLINVGVPREHRGAEHGVPVYLTGEMDAREAAMACQWLGVTYAIPCHHDDPTLPEVVRFRDLLTEACAIDGDAPRPVLLSPGERMVLHEGNTGLSALERLKMKQIRLGKTDLDVSRVGFGGIPIQRLTEAEAVRVVQSCVEMGITFIDTANGYTTSEERIGKALVGRRDQVIIATKTGARDAAGAQAHIELSLRRLQTDSIDLLQFHGVSTPQAFQQVMGPGGAMEAAQAAKRAGKVRHIAASSHSLEVALQLVPSGHFETIQFPFNFVTREPADELLPLAQAHDVGFIAMKPFAGGLLGDAALSIKYLLQFEGVVPDPGIERVDEMREIVGIVEGDWALTAEEEQAIERIRAELGTRFCRRCEYCQPCPQEIPISTVMNLRSFAKRFPAERFFSGRFPQTVEKAKTCLECGECEERCPYHLPIREMLVENVAYYESIRL